MKSCRKIAVLIMGPSLLVACQPTLQSELPTGAAAYENISINDTDAINSLLLLQPDDQIDVRIFQEPDLTVEGISVDQAGNVSLPLIGEVKAAGLSSAQLGREIERHYAARYLRDPHVNVILTKGAARVVSVEGEVKKPGVFEVQQGYTLLSALALAGSPSETAKYDEVLIFRERGGQRLGGRFDLVDIRAGRAPDPFILPGDAIVVGYSRVRGAYLDFLKTAPFFNIFTRY